MKEVCDAEELKVEIQTLKEERDSMKETFEELRKDIDQCRASEVECREKLEQSEAAKSMYETTMESRLSEEVATKKEMLEKMKVIFYLLDKIKPSLFYGTQREPIKIN